MSRSRLIKVVFLVLIAVLSVPFMRARGTVSQIDGTILPDGNALLQGDLETAEGISDPADPQYLDATLDAYTFPQIFLPPEYDSGQLVTFTDVAEHAGFENSFGWYNVGDTSRLFKILDCNTWNGGVNHEPGDSVSVDFDQEFDNGNWDGGFIGFYLITPEDNNTGNNCGDFSPSEYFGHIYYSESELNGDGDYVHHLVYTSKIDEERFYFAFEDLFRGGDNDFSDMTIRVEGLTPPCIPEAEVCDGMDNDCDGLTDEDPLADAGDPCGTDVGQCEFGVVICDNAALVCDGGVGPGSEICDSLDNDCDGQTDNDPIDEGGTCGTNVGECSTGQTVCTGGVLTCENETGPTPEVCDGLDNDCNGAADDSVTDDGDPCGTDVGECQPGITACLNGALVCQGEVASTPEICDSLDNDCDGTTDNDPIDEGGTCGTNVGECSYGSTLCQGGALVCDGAVGPQPEMCDGLDNDCNGSVDDNPSDAGGACGTDVGECSQGVWICSGGGLVCQGAVGPQPELCDGLDNDCNGSTDDDPIDAGSQCGSGVGECEAGTMVCQNGALTCDGAVGPQAEVCDGLDNDCNGSVDDNAIDEGGACGTGEGLCEPGLNVCSGGVLVCQGEIGPQPELCDGLDNDCDGEVDNGDPGGGGSCGITDEGVCELGVLHCIAGSLSCVGAVDPSPEACNCIDDDCDGDIDNGAECPEPFECIDCACRKPCEGGEFECPGGMVCEDGFCVPTPCFGVECPSGETCVDGECIEICDIIECEEGTICEEGRCVENNCYGLGCPQDEVCIDAQCVTDPCESVECGPREFCRFGECVDTCERVVCPSGQQCEDGACVADPCADKECEPGFVCIEGSCVTDPCGLVDCGQDRICDQGECIDDPCRGVTCPLGGVCRKGQCEDPPGYVPGTEGDEVLITGAGGCSCEVSGASGGGSSSQPLWWGLLLLGALLWVGRRGRRHKKRAERHCFFEGGHHSLIAAFLGLVVPLVVGCEMDPHQFPGTDAFIPGSDAGAEVDAYACEPTNGGVEICDGLDNDCDGQFDEGFELSTDPENCGFCGNNCALPGAYTDCREGECVFLECAPGYKDNNNDLEDGCEYYCVPTNEGNEACDELDNDCDGLTDESFDLDTDTTNCGSCGVVCAFTNANADCVAGECVLVECLDGFLNLNGLDSDGCEYACEPTNGGVEICDGLDNDCDGGIDNDVDTSTDPLNCGACGNVCSRPNAVMDCVGGNCEFVECDPGYVDANTDLNDGCEYLCDETNGGVEICDGVDNDCNGAIDDNLTDTGGACGDTEGECVAGTTVCSSGVLVCSGGIGPQTEACDGLDNDCDGLTDNGTVDSGGPCGTGMGECQQGTLVCASGVLECQGGQSPENEICDGLDNDCDGVADNNLTDVGGVCGEDTGECQQGVYACSSGVRVCAGEVTSQPELCDGLDNDCDGTTDNNTVDTNDLCGTSVGECEVGVTICQNGAVVCDGNTPASPELCDGLDNDCDGTVDNNTQGSGQTCGVTDVGPCEYGVTACIEGTMECVGNVDPEPSDVCDGIDNDCDNTVDVPGCLSVATNDIRLDAATDPGEYNSVQVDMDASGDRIHVVWLDSRDGYADDELYYADIYHTCSNDGGATWITEERLDSGSSDSVKPRVLLDSAGWAYVAYEDFAGTGSRQIFFRRASSCSAGAFSSATRLDAAVAEDSLNIDLAADGSGNVFVVWEDFVEGSGSSDSYRNIFLSASTDYGATWSSASPVRVNQSPSDPTDAYATVPQVAVGSLGRALVVWADARNGATDIYFNYTDDGGTNFLASDVMLSSDSPGANASKFPRLVSNGSDNVVVVWEDLRRVFSDIRYNYSGNNGATWQASDLWLDSDKGDFSSYEVSLVWGQGNRVHAAWRDFREGLPRVRVATSNDNGATFGTGVLASYSPGGATEPQLAANGSGKVFVAFACDPDGLRDTYVNYSLDNGFSFQPDDLRMDISSPAGDAESFTPRLAVGPSGNAFVVWVDTRANEKEGDIYFNYNEE